MHCEHGQDIPRQGSAPLTPLTSSQQAGATPASLLERRLPRRGPRLFLGVECVLATHTVERLAT